MVFEVGIGTSQNWDPEKAAEEALEQALLNLTNPPTFILTFCTIHYKQKNGFKKILKTIYKKFSSKIPLLGGSIAGFMNNSGCFTKGITLLLCYSDEITVNISFSKNTKLFPKKAGNTCAKKLNTPLLDSSMKKYFIFLISSATVPNLPIINKKVINIKWSNILLTLFNQFSSILQIGPSKDETVFEEFSKILKDSKGIGGGVCDNLELFDNALFVNYKIYKNSVAALSINTKRNFSIFSSNGLHPTDKLFNITNTSKSGYIINTINNLSPLDEYLNSMNWSENIIDERLYRKIFYYPIINESDPKKETRMLGLIYGKKFVFPMKAKKGMCRIYQSTGKDIINSGINLVPDNSKEFGFGISCGTRLETLGKNAYIIQNNLSKKLKNFLIIYTAGEYYKNEITSENYQTDNILLS